MEEKNKKKEKKSLAKEELKKEEGNDSSRKVLMGILIAAGVLLIVLVISGIVAFGYFISKMKKDNSPAGQKQTSAADSKLTYENQDYGFRLKMTDVWKDYKVHVKPTDGGFGAAKIDFYLPSQMANYTDQPGYVNLFTVNAYYIDLWSDYQEFCQTAMCAGEEIGRNSQYVFTYYHINGFPPDDVSSQAMPDMEKIIKGIEIFEPDLGEYQAALDSFSQSVASADSRPLYDVNFAEDSIYYFNCKYKYSINYPASWTTETATRNSIQVFFVGPQTRMKVESLGLVPGQSLKSFSDERTSLMEGNLALSETIDWDGTSVVRSWFTHPDSQALHWITGNRGMELMAFGTGYNSQFTTIEKMLGTLYVNSLPAECGSTSSTSSSSTSGLDCSGWTHPNGDIEYWWDEISEAERQCYISRFGYPPIQ